MSTVAAERPPNFEDNDDGDLDGSIQWLEPSEEEYMQSWMKSTVDDEEDGDEEDAEDSSEAMEKRAFLPRDIFDEKEDDEEYEEIVNVINKMKISPPNLADVTMGFVTQFWKGSDDDIEFVLETPEVVVPIDMMRDFCTKVHINPLRARSEIQTPTVVELGSDDDDEVDEDDPCIPRSGRVNVIVHIHAQVPVLVGILSERYNLDGDEQPPTDLPNKATLERLDETMNGTGGCKRIHWVDFESFDEKKKARTSETSIEEKTTTATTVSTVASIIGEPAEGNDLWVNQSVRQDVVCVFERNAETGWVTEVRYELSLHAPRFRRALQDALEQTRSRM